MAKGKKSILPPDAGAHTGRKRQELYGSNLAAEPLPGLAGLADGGNSSGAHPTAERNSDFEAAKRELAQGEVWERVRRLALRQLNRLVSLESKVLRDEFPEAVHDLRVASRRLQSLLDFLYPVPRPPHLRKLRGRLKQARKVLGELRNQDVLVARIARVLARKRAARREAWEAGQEYVVKLRSKTVERAHRELSRLNLAQVYVRLRQELTAFEEPEASKAEPSSQHSVALPRPVPAGAPSEHPIASGRETDAAARFAKRLGELWKDFDTLAAKSRRDPGVLHPLRIATKRLRYLVEVAAALNAEGSSRALDWLRDLQGKLGDWHDLEVLDATLIDMLARPKFLRANLPLAITVERLILALRASKTRHCHSYLRRALQSGAYRQTAAWVNQSAIRQPLPAG
ncbi:MAG TPA: CHAD domain-containing protein [Terriglobia bacterium]|nr:CHAD domain-containing protein [Terriglobia bacterium]